MPRFPWPHSFNLLTKIVLINLTVLFVSFLALMLYVVPLYEEDMREHRRQYIASQVEMAHQLVSGYYQRTVAGLITVEEAKQQALTSLQVMARKDDYFWVHSLDMVMVMHPYETQLVGKQLPESSKQINNTRQLFQAMNRIVSASGQGYIEYDWPKPGGREPVPKVSYVKLFEPWGWVIGSGMYVDDIRGDVASLRQKVYLAVVLLFLVIVSFSVAAALRIKRPIQQALELLKGVPEQYRPRLNEIGHLDESSRLLQAMVTLVAKVTDAKDEAEATSAAKGEFLAQMSHEIRTPMNAITGLVELALDQAASSQQRELLESIRHAANHLLSLVNQVLDFSKLTAGSVELERIVFNLPKTVSETLLPFSVRVRSKGLVFTTVLADDLPTNVIGDPTRLRQVLVNLVGNAVKFTSQGSIEVRIERGESSETSCELLIAVRDTGVGIPREKIDQIFAPYTQASASITREYGGTGLGLSIVRQLVDVMQGTITVESQQGIGTVFVVSLPVGIPGHEELPECTKLQTMPAQRVLIAEDNEINRMMLVKLLGKLGHTVDVAVDGRVAVENWKKGGYDLILMDIQMPGVDGLEATRIIRSLETGHCGSHTPIIAMTGQDGQQDIEECSRAGMDLYLKKPVQLCELLSAMARAIKDIPNR